MKRGKILSLFALMLGLGAALSRAVIASEVPTSSAMTNYIQNARTPEDHEHIASLYDLRAFRAQSTADGYARQFECQHSQATTLQRRGVRFPGFGIIGSVGSTIGIWSNRMMNAKAVRNVELPCSMRG